MNLYYFPPWLPNKRVTRASAFTCKCTYSASSTKPKMRFANIIAVISLYFALSLEGKFLATLILLHDCFCTVRNYFLDCRKCEFKAPTPPQTVFKCTQLLCWTIVSHQRRKRLNGPLLALFS